MPSLTVKAPAVVEAANVSVFAAEPSYDDTVSVPALIVMEFGFFKDVGIDGYAGRLTTPLDGL